MARETRVIDSPPLIDPFAGIEDADQIADLRPAPRYDPEFVPRPEGEGVDLVVNSAASGDPTPPEVESKTVTSDELRAMEGRGEGPPDEEDTEPVDPEDVDTSDPEAKAWRQPALSAVENLTTALRTAQGSDEILAALYLAKDDVANAAGAVRKTRATAVLGRQFDRVQQELALQ